jgi:hypothetical protein
MPGADQATLLVDDAARQVSELVPAATADGKVLVL